MCDRTLVLEGDGGYDLFYIIIYIAVLFLVNILIVFLNLIIDLMNVVLCCLSTKFNHFSIDNF